MWRTEGGKFTNGNISVRVSVAWDLVMLYKPKVSMVRLHCDRLEFIEFCKVVANVLAIPRSRKWWL